VIIRGGPAKLSKVDRTPYLPGDDAEALLHEALSQYRGEHRHPPARVTVHKTSRYTDTEIEDFRPGADAFYETYPGWPPSGSRHRHEPQVPRPPDLSPWFPPRAMRATIRCFRRSRHPASPT
jgi:hypothetical protein